MAEFHVLFVVVSVLAVIYSDEQGLMWFLGKKTVLAKKKIDLLHTIVSLSLGGILLTGGLMFLDRASYLLAEPIFIAKMIFVGVLVLNAFFIESISRMAIEKSYMSLSRPEKNRVLLSGTASIIGWLGACLFGLMLGG